MWRRRRNTQGRDDALRRAVLAVRGKASGPVDIRDLFENLWRRRLAVAAAVAFATLTGFVAVFRIDIGLPPQVEKRPVETGAGTAQLVLDSPQSPILKGTVPLEGLINSAAVLANLVQSPPVVQRISEILTIPAGEIATRGAPPTGLIRGREIDADQRATELSGEDARYRIYATASNEAPVITLYTRAPDPGRAVRLADAASAALATYVRTAEMRVPAIDRVTVHQLGPPQAEWVNRGARYLLAGLAFTGALLASVLMMTIAGRIKNALAVDRWRTLVEDRDGAWLDRSEAALATPHVKSRPREGSR
jgi:hypothetical protein